jgi:hypothetical protein
MKCNRLSALCLEMRKRERWCEMGCFMEVMHSCCARASGTSSRVRGSFFIALGPFCIEDRLFEIVMVFILQDSSPFSSSHIINVLFRAWSLIGWQYTLNRGCVRTRLVHTSTRYALHFNTVLFNQYRRN